MLPAPRDSIDPILPMSTLSLPLKVNMSLPLSVQQWVSETHGYTGRVYKSTGMGMTIHTHTQTRTHEAISGIMTISQECRHH